MRFWRRLIEALLGRCSKMIDMRGPVIGAAKIALLLLLPGFLACAVAPQTPGSAENGESRAAAERDQREQKKDTAPPTFTYRP